MSSVKSALLKNIVWLTDIHIDHVEYGQNRLNYFDFFNEIKHNVLWGRYLWTT